jgi:Fe-S-cluster-containing dehydrogenase component
VNKGRRRFLEWAGFAAAAALGELPLFRVAAEISNREKSPNALVGKKWAMIVDVKKCSRAEVIGACITACHKEHNVPLIKDSKEEIKWIWTESFERVFPDQAHPYLPRSVRESSVPVLCNHCDNPPCVKVCPTGATFKRPDGIVAMDMHRCIGCRYCMSACPYGARSFNWSDPRNYLPQKELSSYPIRAKGVVEKCTFCAERLTNGLVPACVEACQRIRGAENALVFGDLNDPHSEPARILREKRTIRRKPALGTGPNVFYIV